MALVVFGEKIDFTSISYPEQGGYIVGYDINTDLLSQMDYLGNVTVIGGNGSGSLLTTLSLGNSTGTNSIVLDSSIIKGTNLLSLDNNTISLTTDNGVYNESYLFLNSDNTILGNGIGKSFRIETSGIITKWSDTDKQTINTNSYELILNNLSNLQFGQLSSGAGGKLSGLISTDNSTIETGIVNTVVVGGQNIDATQSNSVYVPYLLIQDGKVIKGTKGSGQIKFTETGDIISSNDNSVIGVISSTSSIIFTQNGIFIKDSATASSSPNINTGITYISTKNSSATASIKNSVIVGGQNIVASKDNTVYLGNNVNINNAFTLPTTDGSTGHVLKTDGLGNVVWGGVSLTLNSVTLSVSEFQLLNGIFEGDTTYIITDADFDLYGGTEIYIKTNMNGILDDEGVGKFYNPSYDHYTLGDELVYGSPIWDISKSYFMGDSSVWGGYVWTNTTGFTGTASDIFTLNSTNWLKKIFDEFSYNISYDIIKYDWQNDLIIYRNEKNINIVSSNKLSIDTFKNINPLFNPIKSFQWGNLYDIDSAKGIGNQNIINSYNENINFRGNAQVNISMNNLSAQYNLNIGTIYTQSNLTFDNYLYNRQSVLLSKNENGLAFQGSSLSVGTAIVSNGRFVVSSSGGTVSLIVDENGSVYNNGNGSVSTNTVFGASALSKNTTGYTDTAIGVNSLYSNTTGNSNTGIGYNSLYSNTTGNFNTGIGYNSLYSNITGGYNIGIGYQSLYYNTTGIQNTGIGYNSLFSNTTGYNNTTIGEQSLYSNTTGYNNTSMGEKSLYNNTTGTNSIAIGHQSLYKNNTGNYNSAIGAESLYSNTTRVTSLSPTFSAGSGYTPGTWSHIVLFRVGGTPYFPGGNTLDYPQVTIVVGTGGTVSSVNLISGGTVIPDTNVIFGIQTGSLSYQIPGSGSGFSINIASIIFAGVENTAIGYKALNNVLGGSRNIGIGSLSGNSEFLIDTNDSIYIGYNANSSNYNVSNEIVIGATALGNGSNTVTLGNDSIIKTYLKGSIQLPIMTTAQINLVSIPTEGQLIYNTDLHQICFYNGSSWRKVTDSAM